ncbi:hypothetical protein Q1695_003759 [Nippostrongylus brasiliensis]|nr:hypothetical protein Q1695_003759 [Nippostrongylus brasiliensis]
MDTHEQLRGLQQELRELKRAIPPLPEPQQLYDRIVRQRFDYQKCTEMATQLMQRLPQLQRSTCDSDNFFHDVNFLYVQIEHLRLRFLHSKSQLRIFFSLPPLIITMKKMQKPLWDALMDQSQEIDEDNPLLMDFNELENVIIHQLQTLPGVRSALRDLRAQELKDEEKQKSAFESEMREAVSRIRRTLEEIISMCTESSNDRLSERE